MKEFHKIFHTVLAMNMLLLFIRYYILQPEVMDVLISQYGHNTELETNRNMFKDTEAEQGESEEMLLVAEMNINHSQNSNVSHPTQTTDTNAYMPKDIFPCSFLTFENAVMEQYKHFKTFTFQKQLGCKDVDPIALSKRMKFNFMIQGVQVCNQITYRILKITETMENGVQTEGGSGFMVRSYSHYLTVCPVLDYFNGTYSAMCPFYGHCTNVSVVLKHLQFTGFVGKTKVIERLIWKQDYICISPKDISYGNIMTTFNSIGNLKVEDQEFKYYLGTLAKPRGDLTGELGHWLQYKNRWRWIGMNGEVLPLDRNKTLCTCYQQFKRVYLVGSSHQQVNTLCLATHCQASNILNDRANQLFSKDIIKYFNETLTFVRSDSSNPYAFVIQFGSWDMSYNRFNDVITKYIPDFARHINETYASKRHEYPHMKLLVMSAPSLLDRDPLKSEFLSRNNWFSAVFAKTLRHHMQTINVDFLDEFTFTLPLYTHCWCCPGELNHHYANWIKTTNACIGDVGKAFMALFTSQICPNVSMM